MRKDAAPLSSRWDGGPFGYILRSWRRRRRLSQSDLADKVGVSAKHLSFLETGRAKPSRDMVEWLAQALHLSDDEATRLGEAAGFTGDYLPFEAAVDRERGVHRDLRATLDGLAEPALVHDRFGTIHAHNEAFAKLVAPYVELPAIGGESTGHALLAALAPHVENWPEIADFYRRRVEAEILRGQAVDSRLAELRAGLAVAGSGSATSEAPLPFWVPIKLRRREGDIRAYRLTTMTLGAPHDIAWRDVRLAMLLELPA